MAGLFYLWNKPAHVWNYFNNYSFGQAKMTGYDFYNNYTAPIL